MNLGSHPKGTQRHADALGRGGGVAEEPGKPLKLGAHDPASSTPVFFLKVFTVLQPALVQLRALTLELKLNTTLHLGAQTGFRSKGRARELALLHFSQAAVDWP